jgi:hypothetical protein
MVPSNPSDNAELSVEVSLVTVLPLIAELVGSVVVSTVLLGDGSAFQSSFDGEVDTVALAPSLVSPYPFPPDGFSSSTGQKSKTFLITLVGKHDLLSSCAGSSSQFLDIVAMTWVCTNIMAGPELQQRWLTGVGVR